MEEQLKQLRAEIDSVRQLMQQQAAQVAEQTQAMQSMTTTLQQAIARAERAESERGDMLKIAAKLASSSGGELVDTRGVGQPSKFSGRKDQDFAEWDHKVRTFLVAKFGGDIQKVLVWARKQRKQIAPVAQDSRQVGFDIEFGDLADANDQVEGLDGKVSGLYAYLTSFTTGDANKVVRNSGEGQGLEAWRRLHNEYDPTSSMRRVTILGHVQNPPKCEKIEELGGALEDWLWPCW